jgi:hypothetical protein
MTHSQTPCNADLRRAPRPALVAALGIVLGTCAASAGAQITGDGRSDPVSRIVCYRMVQTSGRAIAWARWEQGLPIEQARMRSQRDEAPRPQVELVESWVSDAYQWRATDEQVREWAAELGNVERVPNADRLSAHETIAIWMRRIARHCGE